MWPKQFWSVQNGFGQNQIDLDLTIMIWSRPKWNGHDQNELVRSKFHFGRDQIIMVKSKSIWSDQNHFGPTKTVLVT